MAKKTNESRYSNSAIKELFGIEKNEEPFLPDKIKAQRGAEVSRASSSVKKNSGTVEEKQFNNASAYTGIGTKAQKEALSFITAPASATYKAADRLVKKSESALSPIRQNATDISAKKDYYNNYSDTHKLSDKNEIHLNYKNNADLEEKVNVLADLVETAKKKTEEAKETGLYNGEYAKAVQAQKEIEEEFKAYYRKHHLIKLDEQLDGMSDEMKQVLADYSYSFSNRRSGLGGLPGEVDTDNEKYAEILRNAGYDNYDELAQRYEAYINAKNQEELQQKNVEFANNHPVASTLSSYGSNLASGVTGVAGMANYLLYGDKYQPLDTNSPAFGATNFTNDVRTTNENNINSSLGKFAYSTGNSIVDSALSMATFGGAPGEMYSLMNMSSQAGTQAAMNATEHGATGMQAIATAIAQGVAEATFEKISLDRFYDVWKAETKASAKAGLDKILTDWFIQANIEGAEELATDIANAISDNYIMGQKSDMNVAIHNYLRAGYTREEAEALVSKAFVKQLTESYIGGFVSGAVMGGGERIVAKTIGASRTGKQLNDSEVVNSIIQTGLESEDGTESRRLAEKLKAKSDKGQKITNADIGNLYQANVNTVDAEDTARKQVKEFSKTLGSAGATAMNENFNNSISSTDYVKGFNSLYMASKSGATITAEQMRSTGLDAETIKSAITAGRIDGGIDNGDVRLQNSSERIGSENPTGEVTSLGESTRTEEEIRSSLGRAADSEASTLKIGKAVTSASLGIENGSTHDVVLPVTGNHTASVKKAITIAKSYGLEVVPVVGNMSTESNIEFRAQIVGDKVYVNVAHGTFTADQLMTHEVTHKRIINGEINVKEVRTSMEDKIGKNALSQIEKLYAEAYDMSDMESDYIFEELICDSMAGMNGWSGQYTFVSKSIDNFLEDTKSKAKENAKGKKNQTRAPGESSVKYSKEFNNEVANNEKIEVSSERKRNDKSNGRRTNAILQRAIRGKDSLVGEAWNEQAKDRGVIQSRDNENQIVSKEILELLEGTAITDSVGHPIAVYHCTTSAVEFEKFLRGDIGFHFGDANQAVSRGIANTKHGENNVNYYRAYLNIKNPIFINNDIGIWDANNTLYATYRYAKVITEKEWIDLTNQLEPLRLKHFGYNSANSEFVRKLLESMGYDGIAYDNKYEGVGYSFIAFHDEQIVGREFFNKYGERDDKKYSRELSDDNYMSAVDSGNMEEAQRMVNELAEERGYSRLVYHGTMNGGWFTFDKSKASPGGNSGAGIYTTTNEYDAENNYEDVEGPDNETKWSELAEQINESGEWNGVPVDDYDEDVRIAKEILNGNPETKTLFAKTTNPYNRDFGRSTNMFYDLEELVDEEYAPSRDDYDDEYDYEQALLEYRSDEMYTALYDIVHDAYTKLENTYDNVDFYGTVEDLVSEIAMRSYDYESLTWDDIINSFRDKEIYAFNEDWTNTSDAAPELTRLIVEGFGYDSVVDKEVDNKFNRMVSDYGHTEHVIVFDSHQLKSADPVTYDDNGNVIPLSQRFDESNEDTRYSRELGYHAGDLGKSESLSQQGYGRGTGHFGTGTYFVGNEKKIEGYNSRDGKPAPVETVDFSKYNLYEPTSSYSAGKLHNFLKYVDGYYDLSTYKITSEKEWERRKDELEDKLYSEEFASEDIVGDLRELFGNYETGRIIGKYSPEDKYVSIGSDGEAYAINQSDNSYIDISDSEIGNYVDLEAVADKLISDNRYAPDFVNNIESFNEMINDFSEFLFSISPSKSRAIIDEINSEINEAHYSYEGMRTADSAATRFMKKLGYEGVDVRAIDDYDNTAYGSVIYDLKGEDLERKKEIGTARFSRELQRDKMVPTFYSKLGREVDNYKGDKIGATSLIPYLKGKGVKEEEIKWSGIATLLEGKKSVTKEEVQKYLDENEFKIEEEVLIDSMTLYEDFSNAIDDKFSDIGIDLSVENYRDMDGEFHTFGLMDDVTEMLNDGKITQEQFNEFNEFYEDFIQNGTSAPSPTNWGDYKTPGGTNYREILFKVPGSDYSNNSMLAHWGRKKGILVHARIQDFDIADGKVMFIEEIQSDWHNALMKKPTKNTTHVVKTTAASGKNLYYLLDNKNNNEIGRVTSRDVESNGITEDIDSIHEYALSKFDVEDAPFKNTYTDFALKNLIRRAAEEGYDYVAWTTGKMQEDRWSSDYSEGYRIEYDQNIPKFLNKYCKQWGESVNSITIDIIDFFNDFESSEEVPAIRISDAMKDSVLYDGQPKYSREIKPNASLEKENRNLERKLKATNAMVDYYKGQLKKTTIPKVKESTVTTFARKLISDTYSTLEVKDIKPRLVDLANYIIQTDIPEMEHVKDMAVDIAIDLVDSAEVEAESLFDYKKFHKLMMSGIRIPEDVRRSKNYTQLKKDYAGQIKFNNSGMSLERFYDNLMSEYPEYFSEQSTLEDMLDEITRAADEFGIVYENPYDGDKANAVEFFTDAIIDGILDEKIKQVAPTFADRMENEKEKAVAKNQIKNNEKLNKQKEKFDREKANYEYAYRWLQAEAKRAESDGRIAVEDAIKQGNQKVRDMRDKKNNRIEELKNEFRESKLKERTKRKERELRGKITKHVKDLSGKLVHPTDKKHIPDQLNTYVAKFLEAINMESGYSLNDDGSRAPAGVGWPTKRSQVAQKLRSIYKSLEGELVIDPDLDILLEEIGNMSEIPIQNMSIEQLQTVYEAIRAIEASIDSVDKLFTAGKSQRVGDLAYAVLRDNDSKKQKLELNLKAGQFSYNMGLDMLTPEAYFHRLGDSGDFLFRTLRNGQDNYIKLLDVVKKFEENNMKKVSYQKLENEIHEVILGGKKVKMSTAQIMELYVLSNRKQGHNHIVGDGIKIRPIKKGIKKVTYYESIGDITDSELQEAFAKIGNENIAYASLMQEFVSTVLSEYGNEASMRVYNYKKFTEKVYWPIQVDDNVIDRDAGEEEYKATSVSGKGMAKSVRENAHNVVYIGSIFDTFAKHANDMATYYGYLAPMEDINRVYNFKYYDYTDDGTGNVKAKYKGSFRDVLNKVHGTRGASYMNTLLKNISNGVQADSSYLANLFANAKMTAVANNIRVIIQQPTAILRALSEINPVYLTGGMVPQMGFKKAKQYAPIALWKSWGYFDINTGKQMKDLIFNNTNPKEKIREASMYGAGLMDNLAWGTLWNACELETRAQHKELKKGSEEYYQHVAKRFTEIIDKTQVVDGILQRSQIMRSPSGWNKMATSFMGEPTKIYNMLMTATYDITHKKKGSVKKYVATVNALLISGIVNMFAQSIIDGFRNGDRDKDYWEKVIQAITGLTGEEETDIDRYKNMLLNSNASDFLMPVNYIPYLKDVWSIVQGYTVKRMDMNAISDVFSSGTNLIKAMNNNGELTRENAMIAFMSKVAVLYGIPVYNLKRDTYAAINTYINQTDNLALEYEFARFQYSLNKNKTLYKTLLKDAYYNDKDTYKKMYREILEADEWNSYNEDGEKTKSTIEVIHGTIYDDEWYKEFYSEYKERSAKYDEMYNELISEGFSEDKIKNKIETFMKEEQNVKYVKDLEERYLSPEEDKEYTSKINSVKNNSLWKKATEKQREEIEEDIYNMVIDSKAGIELESKIIDAKKSGISENTYMLYRLAKSMYDADKNGSTNQEELSNAIKALGVSGDKAEYLWQDNTSNGYKKTYVEYLEAQEKKAKKAN